MCRQVAAASKILRVERPNIVEKNYRKISCAKSTVKQRHCLRETQISLKKIIKNILYEKHCEAEAGSKSREAKLFGLSTLGPKLANIIKREKHGNI